MLHHGPSSRDAFSYLHDNYLHIEDLIFGTCFICHIRKLMQLGWIHLLRAAQTQRRYTNQETTPQQRHERHWLIIPIHILCSLQILVPLLWRRWRDTWCLWAAALIWRRFSGWPWNDQSSPEQGGTSPCAVCKPHWPGTKKSSPNHHGASSKLKLFIWFPVGFDCALKSLSPYNRKH